MRISDTTKQSRLQRLLQLLKSNPNGLTEREIADALGISRRVVNNYLNDELATAVYKEGKYWLALRESKPIRSFQPKPEEAAMLYLAMRLLVKQQDMHNPVAENLLSTFSAILDDDLQLGANLMEATRMIMAKETDPTYANIYKSVLQSYTRQLVMDIVYTPYRGKPFQTTLHPYLLEPSAIGFSTYVIGWSQIVNDLRTYKIERIQQATLRRDTFQIPKDFPGVELLRNAWSIYYGEATQHVMLKFHPDVAKRVSESTWHPSQQLDWDTDDPDYLLMTVTVADTTDLKPWIRTWGATCEVLAPKDLREDMIGHARGLARLYGVEQTASDNPHQRFNDIFGA